jgi:Glycosyltransferase family 87
MYFTNRGTCVSERRPIGWLTCERMLLCSGLTFALIIAMLGVIAWSSDGFSAGSGRPGVDFAVFWTGSYMMLHGSPVAVYHYPTFVHTESALFSGYLNRSFLPWLYPPTMLLLVAPLALVPYVLSYAMFVGGSLVAYVSAALRVSGLAAHVKRVPLAAGVVLTYPGVFFAAVIGQNALLTAALATFAIRLLERRPVWAGVCVGLLAIKPQMAVLFPFVLVAVRAWRAFASAAVTAIVLIALSVWACGVASLRAFMGGTSLVSEVLHQGRSAYWFASPSTFAALRVAKASLALAYGAQFCVSLIAVVAAMTVWRKTCDVRLRAAVLMVSTLLAAPYVWHYELVWLGIALFCVVSRGFEKGWLRGEQLAIVLGWLLPAYEVFNREARLAQLGPLVLLLMLFVVVHRVTRDVQEVK